MIPNYVAHIQHNLINYGSYDHAKRYKVREALVSPVE